MNVRVQQWHVTPERWRGPQLRIVMIADVHACWPWMRVSRVKRIVAQAQALNGDLIALMGDYPGHILGARPVQAGQVAAALGQLSAPLGVHAVFGNHDWEDDPDALSGATSETFWHGLIRDQGINVLENRAVTLSHSGTQFALAGLGSQRARLIHQSGTARGVADIDAALGGVPADRFTVLMAHEPDIFAVAPSGVDLTLAGHTHGGQVKLFGRTPVVPSAFGSRYVYGHITENGRDLVVSGGLGCSGLPIRIGVPPELTQVIVT